MTGNPQDCAGSFDLTARAENGLRRGFTTGACATAAVKAALLKLLRDQHPSEVEIRLPGSFQWLTLPIEQIDQEEAGVKAVVVKDAGDDPDQTHRARIFARVSKNRSGLVLFRAGEGVGVV